MTNEKKRREKDLIFGAVQIYPENWRNWVSDGRCFSHGKGERAHSIGLTRGRGEKRGNWAGFRATKFDEEKGGEGDGGGADQLQRHSKRHAVQGRMGVT